MVRQNLNERKLIQSKFPPLDIRIAYKEYLFDLREACDINSYKNRELTEIQCKEVQKKLEPSQQRP